MEVNHRKARYKKLRKKSNKKLINIILNLEDELEVLTNTNKENEKSLSSLNEDKSNLESKLGERDLTIKTLVQQHQSSESAHEEVVTALGTLRDGVYRTIGSSQRVLALSSATNVEVVNHGKIEECENLVKQLTDMQNRLETLVCETRNACDKELANQAQELSTVEASEKDLKVCSFTRFAFNLACTLCTRK